VKTITLTGFDLVTSTAAEEARNNRDALLVRAGRCNLVTDPTAQESATNLLRELRQFSKTIEAGREEAKAPVIELGRNIDALARELSQQVEAEGKRLSTILGAYEIEQRRIAREKQEEAEREARRIRMEAFEKEEAERKRLAAIEREKQAELERQQAAIRAEADAKAARARTDAGRERAAEEARKEAERLQANAALEKERREQQARAEQEARDAEATRLQLEAKQTAVATMPVKQAGTSTREKICFEVENIVALYEAAPYLVNLTPNVAALNSALKGLHGDQKLPGVRHWKEAATITRIL